MNKCIKKFIQFILSLAFWITVWGVASLKINNSFLLPSPTEVIKSTFFLLKEAEFWMITAQSLGRIFLGIIIAVIVGIIISVVTVRFSFVDILVTPFMSTVKATPVASFIFIAIIFMSRNSLPVFITSLLVIPIVWTNVSSGIKSTPRELYEVAKIYKFSPIKKITKLYVPCILPYFLAACRSSLGMAWKAGVAAEVLCTPTAAIGTELYFAKTYMDTQTLFSWTLITVILSLIIEKTVIYFLSRILRNIDVTEVRA